MPFTEKQKRFAFSKIRRRKRGMKADALSTNTHSKMEKKDALSRPRR